MYTVVLLHKFINATCDVCNADLCAHGNVYKLTFRVEIFENWTAVEAQSMRTVFHYVFELW